MPSIAPAREAEAPAIPWGVGFRGDPEGLAGAEADAERGDRWSTLTSVKKGTDDGAPFTKNHNQHYRAQRANYLTNIGSHWIWKSCRKLAVRLPVRVQHWHYAVSYQATFRRAIANRPDCARPRLPRRPNYRGRPTLKLKATSELLAQGHLYSSPGSRANRMANNDG